MEWPYEASGYAYGGLVAQPAFCRITFARRGGSDTHRIEPNRTYGCPSTFVHAASRSVEDILDALKAGRSFITAYPTGPRLDLHIGDAGLGENATILPGMEGLAELENAQVGDILLLLDGIGNRKEWCIPFSGSFHTRFFADNPKARFYRLELYRERLGVPTLTALSNPVYLNPQIGMEKPTIADL
ncbi:hypothetical protein MASR2M78_06230 [Treponema sp.]